MNKPAPILNETLLYWDELHPTYPHGIGTVPWEGWNFPANTNASESSILPTITWLLCHIAPAVAGRWLSQHLALASGSNQRTTMDSMLHSWRSLGAFGNLLAIGTVMAVENFRGSGVNMWNVL